MSRSAIHRRQRACIGLLVAIALSHIGMAVAADTAVAASGAVPPVIAPRPFTETFYGTTLDDPYRFLADRKDPEVQRWIAAQTDYARAQLDRLPGRAPLLERIQQIDAAAPAVLIDFRRVPGRVFYLRRGTDDNQFKLFVRNDGGAERLLVDPDAVLRADRKAGDASTPQPGAINFYEPSPRGRYVAFGVSAGGSEAASLYVIEIANGRRIAGPISRSDYASVGWLPNENGLFFTRLQELKPGMPEIEKYQKIRAYLLRLPARAAASSVDAVNAAVEQAPSLLAFDTPGTTIDAAVDAPTIQVKGAWAFGVVTDTNQREFDLYVAPLADVLAGRQMWRKLVDRADDVVDFALAGDRLFLLSHKDAPRYRLLETSLAKPDLGAAQVVVAESDGVLEEMSKGADALYLIRRVGTQGKLLRVALTASTGAQPTVREIALPINGHASLVAGSGKLPGAWVELESWVSQRQIFAVDASGAVRKLRLLPDNPVAVVAARDYEAHDVLVPSHDGARVPLTIVHRNGLGYDGRRPTLLTGYAAYGITEEPRFIGNRLAWLERGGVLAVANPRGSGAFGKQWHLGGFQATKPNTWKDFIACAEYLIAQKITSSAQLGIISGSAGGILIGRAVTERPDLFAAAIPAVGVLDTVHAELEPNGVGNVSEFGSIKTEAGFKGLLAMSTYQNIRDGERYPALLIPHGLNDPRVDITNSLKGAARFQQATASGRPVLLLVDDKAGHGIGATREQRQRAAADQLSFLLWQFGDAQFRP